MRSTDTGSFGEDDGVWTPTTVRVVGAVSGDSVEIVARDRIGVAVVAVTSRGKKLYEKDR